MLPGLPGPNADSAACPEESGPDIIDLSAVQWQRDRRASRKVAKSMIAAHLFPLLLVAFLSTLICIVVAVPLPRLSPAVPAQASGSAQSASLEDVRLVRNNIYWEDPEDRREGLEALGRLGSNRVFDACQAILVEPKNDDEIGRVLSLLRRLKADRRFRAPALRLLKHADSHVRSVAVMLLGQIGTVSDASAVAACLFDPDRYFVCKAADALEKIGGPSELAALDHRIRQASLAGDETMCQYLKRTQHQLKQRLGVDW
jgi:hypothetical protein